MPFESTYHDLIAGRRRGPLATLARGGLWALAGPYALAVRGRNLAFDRGWRTVHAAAVPVISVGNLTVGGVGKTPLVEWLCRYYRSRGVRVATLSRGYRSRAGSSNDEALQLAENLPDVPHLANPNRVASARVAVEERGVQLLVLDDGFQHRQLGRDLDIVLLDATNPFGGGLAPRGLLREPVASLARADIIGLTRADQVDESTRKSIRERARKHAPEATWIELAHQPQFLANTAQRRELTELAGERVLAFCGIANPAAFARTLTDCGCELASLHRFPDHHHFGRDDIESLKAWVRRESAEGTPSAVLCTQKDFVKLRLDMLGGVPLYAVHVAMEIRQGQDSLERRLAAIPSEPAAKAREAAR